MMNGFRIAACRQLVIIESDRGGDVPCLGPRARHAARDDFAGKAEFAGSEDRLRRTLEALERRRGDDRPHADHVVCGEDRFAKALGNVDESEP